MTFKQWLKHTISPTSDADLVAVKALRFLLKVETTILFPKRTVSDVRKLPKRLCFGTLYPYVFRNGTVSEVRNDWSFRTSETSAVSELFLAAIFRLLLVFYSETVPFRTSETTVSYVRNGAFRKKNLFKVGQNLQIFFLGFYRFQSSSTNLKSCLKGSLHVAVYWSMVQRPST